MAIIGISGKKQSGKDTVGRIIQIITNSPHFNDEAVVEFINKPAINPKFEVKKFADKLKDIHCLLFGCTREQLEDEDFKNTELGEEWWYWVIVNHYSNDKIISPLFSTQKEAKQWEQVQPEYEDTGGYDTYCKLIKPTHRLFLQLLGTQAGRQIIHLNIWCNSLMSEYIGDIEEWKIIKNYEDSYEVSSFGNVRSLDRNIIYGNNKGENHNRKGIILKPTLSGGYFTVSLKGKTHTVHSLVGEAFLNKTDNDFVLNHKDYNKQNNFYKNLEYISQGDNVRHNYLIGNANIGENQKDAKLTNDCVIAIRKLLEGKTLSQNKIAKLFDVSPTTITDIKKGRKWNHVGKEIPVISPIIPKLFPNWIITDVRFPNEVKAIEDKQGITIRVNRLRIAIVELASGKKRVANLNEYPKEHESETALDDYGKWNYVINNDGTLLELVQKVREILIKTNTI